MPNHVNPNTGKPVISVTTLIGLFGNKDGLLKWAARMGQDFDYLRWEGADLGSYVHKRIEAHLTNTPEPGLVNKAGRKVICQDQVAACWRAYTQWYTSVYQGIARIETEASIMHPSGRYAGTADLLLTLKDGRLVLGDFKTSNDYGPSSKFTKEQTRQYQLQLGAYSELFRAAKNVSPDEGVIINLNKKTGTHKLTTFTQAQLRAGYAAFEALLNAHEAIQALQ